MNQSLTASSGIRRIVCVHNASWLSQRAITFLRWRRPVDRVAWQKTTIHQPGSSGSLHRAPTRRPWHPFRGSYDASASVDQFWFDHGLTRDQAFANVYTDPANVIWLNKGASRTVQRQAHARVIRSLGANTNAGSRIRLLWVLQGVPHRQVGGRE